MDLDSERDKLALGHIRGKRDFKLDQQRCCYSNAV